MDENFLEQAQALSDKLVEDGIRATRRLKSPAPEHFDGSCSGCGDDVPEARSALGYYRCINCQERVERLQRLTRR